MDSPFYEFEVNEDAFRFYFESVGPKGIIPKIIVYRHTTIPEFYNLTMGDTKDDGSIDVYAESKNNDMEKILSTIIQTMFAFFAFHPKAKIIFTGSTPSRTRLYQIALAKEFRKIEPLLKILGWYNGQLEPFIVNKNYEGFVISKKKTNIEL
jgi:hypothetical protein